MPFRGKRAIEVIFAFWVCVAGTGLALADTYRVGAVAYTQDERFASGDDFGDYTIDVSNSLTFPLSACGAVLHASSCYETVYVNDPTPVFTTTPPPLKVDPHPIAGDQSCAIPADFDVLREFCVNGHLLFSAYYDPPGGKEIRGVFDGPDPTLDFLGFETIDGGFMTANGNAYFIDGFDNTLVAAIDLDTIPVPEPGSLMLVGTGALGVMRVVRRRTSKRC